ncbi:OsmC family protein [Salmonirosea aquatica]|uniref:OsmC family peroxiredoxin n=1 Tax=Salmonirosea aquatica TaxID=2654236 RepID=A0A7C9BCB7_9BACT|nr:OsmC family peroxiredoxin [Cytophagaceae bacterium SJW1-29]
MSVTTLQATLGEENYLVSLHARHHEILADEPVILGGQDQGIAPYELILAGLGACTSITLKMYAQRKGWVLKEVDVTLEMSVAPGTRPVISRRIQIKGEVTPAQCDRLLAIANSCPVHKLLSHSIQIESALFED